MEIEKKYLITSLPKDEMRDAETWEISQGYLCGGENMPTIRIRRSNQNYVLTYKSRAGIKQEDDIILNQEEELPLTKECFLHLAEKIDGNMVEKTRYRFPIDVKHLAELDVFHGKLEGLMFVEVEFDSVQDARDFSPPAWFGKDVSEDYRFINRYLSTLETAFDVAIENK